MLVPSAEYYIANTRIAKFLVTMATRLGLGKISMTPVIGDCSHIYIEKASALMAGNYALTFALLNFQANSDDSIPDCEVLRLSMPVFTCFDYYYHYTCGE